MTTSIALTPEFIRRVFSSLTSDNMLIFSAYFLLLCFSLCDADMKDCIEASYSITAETSVAIENPKPCFLYKSNLIMNINATGHLSTHFPLLSLCDYNCIEVLLMSSTNIENEATCPESSFENFDTVAKKVMSVKEQKKINGTLFEIPSGCYALRIEYYKNKSRVGTYETSPKYFKTVIPYWDEEPFLLNQKYFHEKNESKVTFSSNFSQIHIRFFVSLKEKTDKECKEHGREHASCHMKKGNVTCEEKNGVTKPSWKFEDGGRNIEFTFYNVSSGNCCVSILVDSPVCIRTQQFCTVRYPFATEPNELGTSNIIIGSNINFPAGLGIIIFTTVLIFAGLLFLLYKKSSHWNPIPVEPPDERLVNQRLSNKKIKVLLLYARDCEYFMTVMKSFRKVLDKTQKFEVFDYYDNDDVSNGPVAWLQGKMSQSEMYTIVVTSECAYLQQMAINSECSMDLYKFYKDPIYLDTLFIYGLKIIAEDVSPNIYRKSYIIGFDGFSEDKHMLSLPAHFRRYILPGHFNKFLSDMSGEDCQENNYTQYTVDYVNLISDIKFLNKYKSTNPDYLEQILNI